MQQRYPTCVDDVARVIRDMLAKRLSGIYHFSSNVVYTKYALCEVLAGILHLDMAHISPVSQPVDALAKRPHDTKLDTDRLVKEGVDVSTGDFSAYFSELLLKGKDT